MPQISQIAATYASQILMVPKVMATVDAREGQIAGDLAAAEQARLAADQVEAAWRAKMDEARAAAHAETTAAKAQAVKATESQIRSIDVELAERLAHHDLAVGNAKAQAMLNLQSVAADVAQELVAKVAGLTVSIDAAADAVRRSNAHG